MICKKCGAENSTDSNFCLNCGEKLDTNVTDTVIEQPVIEAPVEPVQSIQTEQIPVQPVQFEQPVQPVSQEPINNTVEKKTDSVKIILICILSFVVLLLVVVVILFATGIIKFDGIQGNKKNEPVINNDTKEKKEIKKQYSVGEAVTTVDGSKWHVIGVQGDKVTLLLDELVVSDTGYGPTRSEDDQKYVNSNVKKYIEDTYMPELKNKLTAAGGDTSNIEGRLITIEEYFELTQTEFNDSYTGSRNTTEVAYDKELKEKACEMRKIMTMTKSFWTGSNLKDYDPSNNYYGAFYVHLEENRKDSICNNNDTNWALTDFAASGRAGYGATLVGIRPVIETPTSNIK